jgi:hypothetical protein
MAAFKNSYLAVLRSLIKILRLLILCRLRFASHEELQSTDVVACTFRYLCNMYVPIYMYLGWSSHYLPTYLPTYICIFTYTYMYTFHYMYVHMLQLGSMYTMVNNNIGLIMNLLKIIIFLLNRYCEEIIWVPVQPTTGLCLLIGTRHKTNATYVCPYRQPL